MRATRAHRYVVTQKANGEMFTANVVHSTALGAADPCGVEPPPGAPALYWVVLGSKANKFSVWVDASALPSQRDRDVLVAKYDRSDAKGSRMPPRSEAAALDEWCAARCARACPVWASTRRMQTLVCVT